MALVETALGDASRVMDAVPSLPEQAGAYSLALARVRSCVPAMLSVRLPRIGTLDVEPDSIDWHTTSLIERGQRSPVEIFALHYSASHGPPAYLAVEARLGLALVAAALAATPPLALRPMGRGERGVLAAVLAGLLVGLGQSHRFTLSLAEPYQPPNPGLPLLELGLAVRWVEGGGGRMALQLPVTWLPGAEFSGKAVPRAASSAATVSLELGSTSLPADVVAEAKIGDAVVFEGRSAPERHGRWPVRLRLGSLVADGACELDGGLRLSGRFVDVTEESIEMATGDEGAQAAVGPGDSETARILAAAPVEITAEIGRITIRGDELAGLVNGAALPLGARRPDRIVLRIGGRAWATGELVKVGEELAVRITHIG